MLHVGSKRGAHSLTATIHISSLKHPLSYARIVLCRWIHSRVGRFYFICRAGSWATETPRNATCRQSSLASPSAFASTTYDSLVQGFEVESGGSDLLGVQGEGGECSCREVSHRDHHRREHVSLFKILAVSESTSLYPSPDAVQPRNLSAVSKF